MNEIIGPIYYVFASDPNNEWKGNVLQFIFDLFQISETVVKLIDFIKLKIKRIFLFFKFDELALALLRIEISSAFLPSSSALRQNLYKQINSFHIQNTLS